MDRRDIEKIAQLMMEVTTNCPSVMELEEFSKEECFPEPETCRNCWIQALEKGLKEHEID